MDGSRAVSRVPGRQSTTPVIREDGGQSSNFLRQSLAKRQEESKRQRAVNGEGAFIPVVPLKYPRETRLKDLSGQLYNIPKDYTISMFAEFLRAKPDLVLPLATNDQQALLQEQQPVTTIYIAGRNKGGAGAALALDPSMLLDEADRRFRDEDGFLYLEYASDDVFDRPQPPGPPPKEGCCGCSCCIL